MADAAPLALEVAGMRKRFGAVVALDGVSLRLPPGRVHAVLGENGAGKSTLVKCVMGYHRPDAGRLLVDGVEHAVASPRQAHALGLGMVYQHFTLVPGMTVAENLVLGLPDLPLIVDWRGLRGRLEAFLRRMPFRLDLDRPVASLAAGEKQKVEILKQLFLGRRVLILDEPTSVLTPDEADQILGALTGMAAAGRLSVVLITHKFREVERFAQDVTVLRGGRLAGQGAVADLTRADLARMMVGPAPGAARELARGPSAIAGAGPGAAPSGRRAMLQTEALGVLDDKGLVAVHALSMAVAAGEIVGVAGVSGNGQRELVEVLAGQRRPAAGRVLVGGEPYRPTRAAMRRHRLAVLPEEPLRNACVRGMSVAENLAFRTFDAPENTAAGCLVRRGALRAHARGLMQRFRIRAAGPDAPLSTLSGGNVQRTVLARELDRDAAVLIVQNPCAGLDFAATAEIRARLVRARDAGAAVLLLSEDLDEVLELADRLVVMFEGRIVHETPRAIADVHVIGHHMAGR
jgi:simple sugar transport system ATP-binding protein